MRIRSLAAAAAIAWAGAASSQTITVAYDVLGTPYGTLPAFSPTTFFILVQDPPPGGFTGAEFRVDGLPATVIATVVPGGPGIPCDPGGCGNPFVEGARYAVATCRTESPAVLFTGTLFALAPVPPTGLRVVAHSQPSLDCPSLVLCDAPVYTRVCARGGTMFLNCGPPECSIATGQSTWTVVKRLYGS